MADLQRGTALVMPTEGFSTQDYEQGKFVVGGGSVVAVRTSGGVVDQSTFNSGTTSTTIISGVYQSTPSTIADGKAAAIGIDVNRNVKITQATLEAGEDLTNNVLGVLQKPVSSSVYTPTEFTSFGAAAGTGVAVKASAGNIYSVYVTSAASAIRYFQVFNSATALAVGGTPIASYPLGSVPAGGIYELKLDTTHFAPSRYMSTGIAVAISSTNGTLGTASVTASEHNILIKYI